MIERHINSVFMTVAVAIYFLAMWAVYSHGAPGIVGIFEMRFGAPGTPHVVPECGCTMRYVGTRVEGRDFYVHFRQLD